jgi:drug/metabolite transporter (DMT)-like permease
MPPLFVVIWSTGFIVARYGMPHAPPMRFLAWRFGLSALAFALWIAASRPPWPRSRAQVGHLAMVGVLMQVGYLGGVWAAVKHGMAAGTVALIVGLQPVLTALWVAATGGGPRVSVRQWLGLACGLAGLLLVVGRKLGLGEVTALNFGLSLLALAAITAGTLYQKRYVQATDVRTASLVQMLAAVVVALPLGALEAQPVDWQPELIGALAWSVLGLTLGANSLLFLLIQRGAATEVTSLLYLVPPCTALQAALLFGETLTPAMLGGLALTALGVALVVRTPRGVAPAAAD